MKNSNIYYLHNTEKGLEDLILSDFERKLVFSFERKSSWFIWKRIKIFDNQNSLLLEYRFFELFFQKIKIVENNVKAISIRRKNLFKYNCYVENVGVIELSTNIISISPTYSKILLNGNCIGKIKREVFSLGISFKIEILDHVEITNQILIFVLINMSNKEICE